MIPEKIQSFRKILERNNLITVLCLLLVLVSFILNYLERRETLGKQLEFSYYVATDGEVIPARYAQRRDNIEIEIRHHLAMFVDDWYALTQDTCEGRSRRVARRQQYPGYVYRAQGSRFFQSLYPG